MKKKYYKNLKIIRNKIKISSNIESQKIDYVLKWLKKKNMKNKMKIKKVKILYDLDRCLVGMYQY